MNKPWLNSYPKGISPEIEFKEYSSLVDMFEKTSEKFYSKTAFTNFGVKMSFVEIQNKSQNLSSFLQNELKLEKGARVAIMLPNILQYPISTFSILKAGYIVENINPLFTERELEIQLKDSRSEAIIILENFAHNLEKIIKNTSIKHVIITSTGDLFAFKGKLINAVRTIETINPNLSAWNGDSESIKQVKIYLKI